METNATTTNAETEAAQLTNALERRLDLLVAIEELEKDIDQRLKRIGKNFKMPGFRPGKVPANIVKQQYGEQAHFDALNEALERVVDLGRNHDPGAFAGAREPTADHRLRLAAAVTRYPARIDVCAIDEIAASIDERIEDRKTGRLVGGPAEHVATQAQRRNSDGRTAEGAQGGERHAAFPKRR